MVAWLVEAQLHTLPEPRGLLNALLGAPGLFPFRMGQFLFGQLTENPPRLDVMRYKVEECLGASRVSFRMPEAPVWVFRPPPTHPGTERLCLEQ